MFFFICYKLDKNITDNKLFFNELDKFKIYKKLINSNYCDNELKLFINAQKIYHKLNNFILKYKLKKFKPGNDSDMYLDIIDINHKNTIKLLIDNRVYLFTIKDIIHIINNHLLHTSQSNNIVPLKIRNPYTNNVLKLHNLYNIFFSLKNRNIFNQIFYLFYKNNFDIEHILIQYKYLLYYNMFIYNINHTSSKYLHEKIIKMFESLSDYFNVIYFLKHDEETIVKKYKKLLIHYFIYTCKESSINTSINNRITLIKKLFFMIDREKMFDVLKKNEIFRLINSDYINEDYDSYFTSENIRILTAQNNSNINNENSTVNENSSINENLITNNDDNYNVNNNLSDDNIHEHHEEFNNEQIINKNSNKKTNIKIFQKIYIYKSIYIVTRIFLNISSIIFKFMQIYVITNSFYNLIFIKI